MRGKHMHQDTLNACLIADRKKNKGTSKLRERASAGFNIHLIEKVYWESPSFLFPFLSFLAQLQAVRKGPQPLETDKERELQRLSTHSFYSLQCSHFFPKSSCWAAHPRSVPSIAVAAPLQRSCCFTLWPGSSMFPSLTEEWDGQKLENQIWPTHHMRCSSPLNTVQRSVILHRFFFLWFCTNIFEE